MNRFTMIMRGILWGFILVVVIIYIGAALSAL
jgi:hypothetical protein